MNNLKLTNNLANHETTEIFINFLDWVFSNKDVKRHTFKNPVLLSTALIDTDEFPIPQILFGLVHKCLKEQTFYYSEIEGTLETRSILAQYNNFLVDNNKYLFSDIFVTNGASAAADSVIYSILNNSSQKTFLQGTPFYPLYNTAIKKYGGKVKNIDTKRDNNFMLSTQQIMENITNDTVGIIVYNPSFPMNILYRNEEIKEIIKIARKHNLYIIVDEVSIDLSFNGKLSPFDGIDNYERIISIRGLSKARGIPGLRAGYLICRNTKLKDKIKECNFSAGYHASIFAQHVIYADTMMRLLISNQDCSKLDMFGIDFVKYKKEYEDMIKNNLAKYSQYCEKTIEFIRGKPLVLDVIKPDAAYSICFQMDLKNKSAFKFAIECYKKNGITLEPMVCFGKDEFDNWFRLTYARPLESTLRGFDEIYHFLEKFIQYDHEK